MKEPARLERNTQRLTECYPPMGVAVRRVLDRMEAQGFRPRIQHAWRSTEEQAQLFHKGTTKTLFGFHNVTGAGGAKESLACDVLDDDHPLGPSTRYLLALAIAARAEGLMTGILWDLPRPLAAGVEAAIAAGDIHAKVKVGFDPTHVQPVGITAKQARSGTRPTISGHSPSREPILVGNGQFDVVERGDTLSGIAREHHITLARILELNPHKLANPNLIVVGEKIRVG